MNRRGFLGMLGIGAGAATVKQSVTLPEDPAAVERFAGGSLMDPPRQSLSAGLKQHRNGYWLDVQDGILYDRIRFAPGSTIPPCVHFFSTPIGQICPYTNVRKNLRHTNLYQGGALSAPREFLARRIIFAVHPTALASDLDALSGEACWEFLVMQKYMAQGPMLLNGPGRAGLRDIVGIKGELKTPLPQEVADASRQCDSLGGIVIPSQAHFGFQLHTPDRLVILAPTSQGGRGLDLLIGFVGLDARGVQ